ncbi:MAG: DUF4364 family protein [Oscillospiraceae bacterium]|nr:DUF4364 family protein [Oscillospiraceae bacterium]
MRQVGFIRSKNELKFLILYYAERLMEPVSYEVMHELTTCDPAIDRFEFIECMNFLVSTEHLSCSKNELYAITRKGVENGRACAHEIPYSVRLRAEKLAEEQNRRLKRARQVRSKVEPLKNGTLGVSLRFSDDDDVPLWEMMLAVPDEAKAKDLTARFQESPEKMYTQLIGVLFPPENK